MADYAEVSRKASIVLVGSFNPAIFHPSWFEKFKLLPSGEIEVAIEKLHLVAQEATKFELDWLTFEVTREKLVALTPDFGQILPMRDLVSGTFSLLEHTPVKAIGLNLEIAFKISTHDFAHKIGHLLAPKDIWNKYLKTPGLRELVVQGAREDDIDGNKVVALWPSQVGGDVFVNMRVNDHYEWTDEPKDGADVAKFLSERWQDSIADSERIILSVIKDAIES